MRDLNGRELPDEQVAAFLSELNALCERHGISFDCSGYECDGIELRFGPVSGKLELSDTFSWPTLRRG